MVTPFDEHLDITAPPFNPTQHCSSSFLRIPIVIVCTVFVFVLLIAGTATTAISYPPYPPQWTTEEGQIEVKTALDGDYKLLGPLLIMAGGFLLIVDVVLCAVLTKEAYGSSSRRVRPHSDTSTGPMNVLGGPFYLAVPSATDQMTPFAFSRHLWTIPNAPLPDFAMENSPLKGSRNPADIARCQQLPFNPDADSVIEK